MVWSGGGIGVRGRTMGSDESTGLPISTTSLIEIAGSNPARSTNV